MALFHRYGENRDLGDIPGEHGLPILGTSLKQLRDQPSFRNQMKAKYGNIYWTSSFGRHTIALLGPDANELVLMDRERNFSSAGGWSPVLELLFPNGLLMRDFQDHRAHRRIMQAAFKQSAMITHVGWLNAGFRAGIEQWPKDGELRVYDTVKQLTLTAAANIFLGTPLGPEADRLNQAFLAMVRASVSLVRSPIPGTRMWRGVRGRAQIGAYLREQIPIRRDSRDTDMFTLLCNAVDDDGRGYTDDDIVDHMIFLLLAAHETVTSALTSMIDLLCKHPEWQNALREECRALEADDGNVPYEALEGMVKCEWAFKETLRLMPPVPVIPRKTIRATRFEG
ncbi:MAG: cytochrome P450, partial [Pseudomonadota bacterium]